MITRLPLAVPTEPRTASLDKDALLQNCFIDTDQNTGTLYAVKRSGYIVGSEAITTGLNRGIFVNPNNPDGGFDGYTQVWYVGDGGGTDLQYFLTDGEEPPVDQFRDLSMDYDVFTSAGATCSLSEYNVSTSTGVSLFLRSVGTNPGLTGYGITQTLNGVNISRIEGPLGTFIGLGAHVVLLLLEGGNYNLYVDGVRILSASSIIVNIPASVTLSLSNNNPPVAAISNLQYI